MCFELVLGYLCSGYPDQATTFLQPFSFGDGRWLKSDGIPKLVQGE